MRVGHSVCGGLCVSACTWVMYVCTDVHGSAGAERPGVGDCACAGVGLWLRAWRQAVWMCRGLLLCAQSVCAGVHVCVDARAGAKALMPELWTGGWRALWAGCGR